MKPGLITIHSYHLLQYQTMLPWKIVLLVTWKIVLTNRSISKPRTKYRHCTYVEKICIADLKHNSFFIHILCKDGTSYWSHFLPLSPRIDSNKSTLFCVALWKYDHYIRKSGFVIRNYFISWLWNNKECFFSLLDRIRFSEIHVFKR